MARSTVNSSGLRDQFAHTGEATSEQHKASAIERFFTCAIPQRWQVGINPVGPEPWAIIARFSGPGEHSQPANVARLRRQEEVNAARTAQFG